jgi:AraC-like DNA-binding protein
MCLENRDDEPPGLCCRYAGRPVSGREAALGREAEHKAGIAGRRDYPTGRAGPAGIETGNQSGNRTSQEMGPVNSVQLGVSMGRTVEIGKKEYRGSERRRTKPASGSWKKRLFSFLLFQIIFTLITMPLLIFYGPFEEVRGILVGASWNTLINEMLARPEKRISMQEASRAVGMSYSHFSRLFEKTTGFKYSVFRNLLRIRQAEELLLTTSMPVSEVAAAIGIDTISYFTRLFKQINGVSPIAYRKKWKRP